MPSLTEITGYKRKYRYKKRLQLSSFLREAKNKPCEICGIKYNYWQMQFDHLDPKTKKQRVSIMRNIAGVKKEMLKCRLLCANCHADVTFRNKHYLNPEQRKMVEENKQLDLI